jgi:hypothetical protein
MSDTDLPSDYDPGDSAGDNGQEVCARCSVTFSGQAGTHGPVFDQSGTRYESFYDTDPSSGPWFCPDCWMELEVNRKQQHHRTLTDSFGGGDR